MHIMIADRRAEVPVGTTVEQLVALEKVEMAQYVTVTINDDVVQTADRATRTLKEGDHVEFLYFMGGGR